MSKHINRRAVIAGTAATATAMSIAGMAKATTHPDAALFATVAQWRVGKQIETQTSDELAQLERLAMTQESAEAWAEATAFEDHFSEICKHQWALACAVASTPVHTREGLKAKCEVLHGEGMFENFADNSGAAQSLLEDVQRLLG